MSEIVNGTVDEIPNGWSMAKGADLFEFVRGVSYSKNDATSVNANGYTAILRAGNLQEGRVIFDDLVYVPSTYVSDYQRLRKGDLVIAMSSGSASVVGKVALVNEDLKEVSFGAFCGLIRPRNETVSSWLRQYFLSSAYRTLISSIAAGININNLKREHLTDLDILLPPISEILRVSTKLEALQACISKARKALEVVPQLLEQFRQSVLASAFRGDLTADWRERHPEVEPASVLLERIRAERRQKWENSELAKLKVKGKLPKDETWKERYVEPEPVDDTDLPELPVGWCWTALEDLATHKSGLAYRSQDFTDEGVQVVKLGTLYQGRFDLTRDPAFLPTDYPELDAGLVKPGDLLVSQTGTRFKRDYGHFVAIPDQCGPLVLNQRVLAVTVAIPIIQKWVEFASRTDTYRDHLFASETGGVNQGNVGIAGIMRGPIPLAPLNEILKIIGLLEQSITTSHSVQQGVQSQLQELEFANQSILAKTFRGELVPQDPNDEPASVLMERIQADRAQDANGNSGRGRIKQSSKTKTKTANKLPCETSLTLCSEDDK